MKFAENQFGRPAIPSSDLTSDNVPTANADYHTEIVEFALTFDGYAHFSDRLSTIATRAQQQFSTRRKLPQTVDLLRACLFFQQRLWRDQANEPDEDCLLFIVALVEAIRAKIEKRG